MDDVNSVTLKIERQNHVLQHMLHGLDLYKDHPAANKAMYGLMRIRYSMLLEENELLLTELSGPRDTETMYSYLRVPRIFLPIAGDTIDDGDTWKKPT